MKIFPVAILLACLASMPTLHAQTMDLSSTGELVDGIVAVVNDGIVLRSELSIEVQRIVARLQADGTPIPPMNELAPQILERLVIHRIQLQRAERLGIQIPDETLNLALANVAERNGLSLSELPSKLAEEGIDYTSFRAEMRDQLIIEQLRQRDVISRINVTPRELDEYIERQAGRVTNNQEFKLSHILVSTSLSATSEEIAAAEAKIADIYQQIQSGESFAELAVANSDSQYALEGGDMGWRKGEELPTLFADVVPGLKKGQVSEPIRSASGFHLVKLDDSRGTDPILERPDTRAPYLGHYQRGPG